jgi:holo-[acyl-carrier protein] synthase
MIAGIGIDLVNVGRMKKILDKWDAHFTGRVFTDGEIDYCTKKAFPAIHFAARFAAKESCLKSMGIGIGMGVRLKDMEVSNSRQGKPELICHHQAAVFLRQQGIRTILLSLTHTSEYAAAVVILER